MKITTTMRDKHYCPCCGKLLNIEFFKSEDGTPSIRLYHILNESDYKKLEEMGYIFGIPTEEGGEEDG